MNLNQDTQDDGDCEKLFAQLKSNTPPDRALLDRLRGQTLSAYIGAHRARHRRRLSRVIAACASLAAMLAVGVILLNTPAKPAYGMADVPRLIRSAKTLHVQGIYWYYEPDPSSPMSSKVKSSPVELWIDVVNSQYVFDQTLNVKTPTTLPATQPATQPSTQPAHVTQSRAFGWKVVSTADSCLNVNPDVGKVFIYDKMPLLVRKVEIRKFLDNTFNMLDQGSMRSFTKVGSERIDGRLFDIWENVFEGDDRQFKHDRFALYTMKVRCWLAPDTGDIGRIEQWDKEPTSVYWQPNVFYYKLERDVAIPENALSTATPAGLTHVDRRPSYRRKLGEGQAFECLIPGEGKLAGYGAWTLEDGSLLAGWAAQPAVPKELMEVAKDMDEEKRRVARLEQLYDESNKALEPAFASLKFGGNTPILNVDIPEFMTRPSPTSPGPEIRFHGHHLGMTRYNHRLIEWALYVPDTNLDPIPVRKSPLYFPRSRANDDSKNHRIGGVPYAVQVFGREEFDSFIRATITERSDDGVAPAEINYDAVMKLAAELRSKQK